MECTSVQILSSQTTVTGEVHKPQSRRRTFQASVSGTGAVAATIVIEVCDEADASYVNPSSTAQWITAATISLSGTTAATDGFASSAPWRFVRARLTAISGTGATATVNMGTEQ